MRAEHKIFTRLLFNTSHSVQEQGTRSMVQRRTSVIRASFRRALYTTPEPYTSTALLPHYDRIVRSGSNTDDVFFYRVLRSPMLLHLPARFLKPKCSKERDPTPVAEAGGAHAYLRQMRQPE